MPGAAQTPTFFLKAAAKKVLLSAECKKALAACGYAPEDFGTYNQVLAKCGAARKRTGGARTQGGGLAPGKEKKGTDRDKWLAECQSGHISENGRHQTDREHNSGNHCPLYDSNNAPCMPHAGMAGYPNTQHGAVTNTDIASSNAANREPGPDGKMGIARERAATGDATKAALDWGMKDDQKAAPQMRSERFNAIRELNAKAGKDGVLPKDGKQLSDEEVKKNYDKERETALKCIEAFFDAQWKAMAANTQRKKANAAKKATKEADAARAAEKKLAGQPPSEARDKKLAEARKKREAAEANEKQANKENDAVKDLDPKNVDQCMGQSKPAADRSQNTKPDPTDTRAGETNEVE